jgi:hypothetical protein
MRLVIVHDSYGNITGVTASPPDGPLAHPQTRPGEIATQVDVPDITVNLERQEIRSRVVDLVKNHRVEMRGGKAELLKK